SWFVLLLVVGALALVYVQARALWWLVFMVAWVAAVRVSGAAGVAATTLFAIVLVLPALVLAVKPLRRAWLAKPVL
ncbi:hypothetical protein, partial [Burkholderia sp. SIMBA_019]